MITGVGQGDEGVDDAGADFSADGQLGEAAVVPGVGAFNDPSFPGLQGEALLSVSLDIRLLREPFC